MVWAAFSILSTVPTLVQISKEHSKINPAKVDKLKKMVDDKEVALVERAEEMEWWMKNEVDVQEKLWTTSELLFQKDVEIEDEWWKVELEKVKLKKKFPVEIESLKDARYVMYEEGFDETIAQVKHFNVNVLINFSMVDQEKKLNEILRQ